NPCLSCSSFCPENPYACLVRLRLLWMPKNIRSTRENVHLVAHAKHGKGIGKSVDVSADRCLFNGRSIHDANLGHACGKGTGHELHSPGRPARRGKDSQKIEIPF